MATKEDYEKTGATAGAKVHKIRITLTSRNVKNLEKCGCQLGRKEESVWWMRRLMRLSG